MELDAFDTRIEVLNNARAPDFEIAAAVTIYERLRTAMAACVSEFGKEPPVEAVIAVFSELCRTAQSGHASRTAE